jgi:hypothetical protein
MVKSWKAHGASIGDPFSLLLSLFLSHVMFLVYISLTSCLPSHLSSASDDLRRTDILCIVGQDHPCLGNGYWLPVARL